MGGGDTLFCYGRSGIRDVAEKLDNGIVFQQLPRFVRPIAVFEENVAIEPRHIFDGVGHSGHGERWQIGARRCWRRRLIAAARCPR